MPKNKEKKSWKEIQRERQLKQQRAQEGERIRLEVERNHKNGHKGYPKGKIFVAVCLIAVIFVSYVAWQSSIQPSSAIGSGTVNLSPTNSSTSPSTPSTPASTLLAPNFSLKDVNGTLFSLNQHSGEVIAIHFMALQGCSGQIYPINDNQLQQLGTVCDRYCGKKPVTMVTVSVATCASCDTILAQIRDYYNVTWAIGNDYDDQKLDIINAYAKYSIQDGTIVLVDKKLNVAQVYTDAITAAALSSKIDQLLLA